MQPALDALASGALATAALALVYRALTAENLLRALRGTIAISGMILFIILGATTFAQILSFSGASNGLVQFITGQGLSTPMIIAGMMLLLPPWVRRRYRPLLSRHARSWVSIALTPVR